MGVPFLCPGMVVSLNVISLASTSFFFLSAFFASEGAAAAAAFYDQQISPYVTNQFRLFLVKLGLLFGLLRLLLY